MRQTESPAQSGFTIATVAGGCFWCLEAVYDQMKGVVAVESGYIGGQVDHPTYEAVCSGRTGYAEAVRITFDPIVVSYRELLEVLFVIHDPTTLNRQGHDVGTQYRSAIFYHTPEQKQIAEEVIAAMTKEEAVYQSNRNGNHTCRDMVRSRALPSRVFFSKSIRGVLYGGGGTKGRQVSQAVLCKTQDVASQTPSLVRQRADHLYSKCDRKISRAQKLDHAREVPNESNELSRESWDSSRGNQELR